MSGLIAIALALSGCVEIAVESEFDGDGGARHSLSSLVDRSLVDDDLLDGELDFEEIEEGAREAGLVVERVDNDEQVGVRLIHDVDDAEDLGDALNLLFNAMDTEGPNIEPFSGRFTESGGGFSATTYRLELTVDGDVLFEDEQEEVEDELDADIGMDMMRQFFNLTYTVSMPGELIDHNGTETGDGQVRWELPFQGTETFIAESEEGSDFPVALILGVGIGFIAIVLLVVGGIIIMRGRSAPATATGAGAETPREPTTAPDSLPETGAQYRSSGEEPPPQASEHSGRTS